MKNGKEGSFWNKRMKGSLIKKKAKVPFLIQNIKVEEVMDESGEVLEDTCIKISFDGLLMYLSVANAYKLVSLLEKTLDTRKG